MKKNDGNKKTPGDWLLYILLPVVILAVWEAADIAGILKPYTMPPLRNILDTAVKYIQNGKLLTNIWVSSLRVLKGFFAALASALILGILVGIFPAFDTFTDLAIQILRPIPPIAWIPLAILWFGIGEDSKVFIIFLGAFFPIFINVVDGIQGIEKKYFELAAVYEVSGPELVFRIILPGALPSIMTGIRVGLGNAWVCVVAAEMIGATSGVGYMLSDGRSLSRPDIVILGMLIVGIVGKLMDDFLRWLRSRLITWI